MGIGGFAKFGISYTFANILLIGSTAFLVGMQKQASMMFERERLPYTVAYLTSMVATVYLIFNGYHFYFTIPIVTIQFVALFLYIMTYIPGGLSAASFCGS